MITKEEYLRDPCGTLSIPLWKWKNITIPGSMKILHQREFSEENTHGFRDEVYFRLFHPLDSLENVQREGYTFRTVTGADFATIAEIINASYADISVTEDYIYALTKTKVYASALWLLAMDSKTGKDVGGAIADLDRETGEGILEWVQVLPEFRRQGIGRMLVTELLRRMQGNADFATVSGCAPEAEQLYRSCGFQGNDIWHILRKI